jgi:hypothetical protein
LGVTLLAALASVPPGAGRTAGCSGFGELSAQQTGATFFAAQENLGGFAEDLARCVAKNVFGASVPAFDSPFEIDHEYGIVLSVIYQESITPFRISNVLLGALLINQVHPNLVSPELCAEGGFDETG